MTEKCLGWYGKYYVSDVAAATNPRPCVQSSIHAASINPLQNDSLHPICSPSLDLISTPVEDHCLNYCPSKMLILPTDTIIKVASELLPPDDQQNYANNDTKFNSGSSHHDHRESDSPCEKYSLTTSCERQLNNECGERCEFPCNEADASCEETLQAQSNSSERVLNEDGCSAKTTALVTASGKLYIGEYDGENRGSLEEVLFPGGKVVDAVIFKHHILFLGDDGNVFARPINIKAGSIESQLEACKSRVCVECEDENIEKEQEQFAENECKLQSKSLKSSVNCAVHHGISESDTSCDAEHEVDDSSLTAPSVDRNTQLLLLLEPEQICIHGLNLRPKRITIQSFVAGVDHLLFLSTYNELWQADGEIMASVLASNNPSRNKMMEGATLHKVTCEDGKSFICPESGYGTLLESDNSEEPITATGNEPEEDFRATIDHIIDDLDQYFLDPLMTERCKVLQANIPSYNFKVLQPQKINCLLDKSILQIEAGPYFSVALVTQKASKKEENEDCQIFETGSSVKEMSDSSSKSAQGREDSINMLGKNLQFCDSCLKRYSNARNKVEPTYSQLQDSDKIDTEIVYNTMEGLQDKILSTSFTQDSYDPLTTEISDRRSLSPSQPAVFPSSSSNYSLGEDFNVVDLDAEPPIVDTNEVVGPEDHDIMSQYPNSVTSTVGIARQFISRQLSWMAAPTLEKTDANLSPCSQKDSEFGQKLEELISRGADDEGSDSTGTPVPPDTPGSSLWSMSAEGGGKSIMYPLDTATGLIRENVAHAANSAAYAANSAASMVATGVRSVSDKVGMLSRHFSKSDVLNSESSGQKDSSTTKGRTVSETGNSACKTTTDSNSDSGTCGNLSVALHNSGNSGSTPVSIDSGSIVEFEIKAMMVAQASMCLKTSDRSTASSVRNVHEKSLETSIKTSNFNAGTVPLHQKKKTHIRSASAVLNVSDAKTQEDMKMSLCTHHPLTPIKRGNSAESIQASYGGHDLSASLDAINRSDLFANIGNASSFFESIGQVSLNNIRLGNTYKGTSSSAGHKTGKKQSRNLDGSGSQMKGTNRSPVKHNSNRLQKDGDLRLDKLVEVSSSMLDVQVVIWGNLGSALVFPSPTVVNGFAGRGITKVACGCSFVVALTVDGAVFVWGDHSMNSGKINPFVETSKASRKSSDTGPANTKRTDILNDNQLLKRLDGSCLNEVNYPEAVALEIPVPIEILEDPFPSPTFDISYRLNQFQDTSGPAKSKQEFSSPVGDSVAGSRTQLEEHKSRGSREGVSGSRITQRVSESSINVVLSGGGRPRGVSWKRVRDVGCGGDGVVVAATLNGEVYVCDLNSIESTDLSARTTREEESSLSASTINPSSSVLRARSSSTASNHIPSFTPVSPPPDSTSSPETASPQTLQSDATKPATAFPFCSARTSSSFDHVGVPSLPVGTADRHRSTLSSVPRRVDLGVGERCSRVLCSGDSVVAAGVVVSPQMVEFLSRESDFLQLLLLTSETILQPLLALERSALNDDTSEKVSLKGQVGDHTPTISTRRRNDVKIQRLSSERSRSSSFDPAISTRPETPRMVQTKTFSSNQRMKDENSLQKQDCSVASSKRASWLDTNLDGVTSNCQKCGITFYRSGGRVDTLDIDQLRKSLSFYLERDDGSNSKELTVGNSDVSFATKTDSGAKYCSVCNQRRGSVVFQDSNGNSPLLQSNLSTSKNHLSVVSEMNSRHNSCKSSPGWSPAKRFNAETASLLSNLSAENGRVVRGNHGYRNKHCGCGVGRNRHRVCVQVDDGHDTTSSSAAVAASATRRALYETLKDITHVVGRGTTLAKQAPDNADLASSLPIVHQGELYCRLFAQYVDHLCDVSASQNLALDTTAELSIVQTALPKLLLFLPPSIFPKSLSCGQQEPLTPITPSFDKISFTCLDENDKTKCSTSNELQGCGEVTKVEAVAILDWLLQRPVERVAQYELLLSAILKDESGGSADSLKDDKRRIAAILRDDRKSAAAVPVDTGDSEGGGGGHSSKLSHERVKTAQNMWRQLYLLATKCQSEALSTASFWHTWPSMPPTNLIAPRRRVLLDSRQQGSVKLGLPTSSRFLSSLSLTSSYGFVVLLSDALLHCNGGSCNYTVYWLDTLWLDAVDNTPSAQSVIQLSLPEDKVTLSFSTPGDRKVWLSTLSSAISRTCLSTSTCEASSCSGHGSGVLADWLRLCCGVGGGDPARPPPLARTASYTFTKHALYKDATYSGQWVSGKMQGLGTLAWPDGRRYTGSFKQSLYCGRGTLEVPASAAVKAPPCGGPVGSLGQAVCCTGNWREGKMDGWGEIRFSNGDVYAGWLSGNFFDKHGVLQCGNLRTSPPRIGPRTNSQKRSSTSTTKKKSSSHTTTPIHPETGSDLSSAHSHKGAEHDISRGSAHRTSAKSPTVPTVVVASVYTGEWCTGYKHGYGVEDDIGSGSKYMGQHHMGERQGPAVVVTLHGVYYEANFLHGKPQGPGLVILEDGTIFDGEVWGNPKAVSNSVSSPSSAGGFRTPGTSASLEPYCNGKGGLYYSNGDRLEGTFFGPLLGLSSTSSAGPLKVTNASLYRAGVPGGDHRPSGLGEHCGSVQNKWGALFWHYETLLGIHDTTSSADKIWSNLARYIDSSSNSPSGNSNDSIATIPQQPSCLDCRALLHIQEYLAKAFCTPPHPLAELMSQLVTAFRATYGGSTTAPALMLPHALLEVRYYTSRLYRLVRALFPILPPEGSTIRLDPDEDGQDRIVVTSSCIIHTWLLPHLYSPLSTLYVLCGTQHSSAFNHGVGSLNPNPCSDLSAGGFLQTSAIPMSFSSVQPQYSYPLPPQSLSTNLMLTSSQLALIHPNELLSPSGYTKKTSSSASRDASRCFNSMCHPLLTITGSPADDGVYWRNLCAWNLLSDDEILDRLEVESSCRPEGSPSATQKPHTFGDDIDSHKKKKKRKGERFEEAIEVFQLISTAFLPRAKLAIVQQTFRIIKRTSPGRGVRERKA